MALTLNRKYGMTSKISFGLLKRGDVFVFADDQDQLFIATSGMRHVSLYRPGL
jgi:hypothetical protein